MDRERLRDGVIETKKKHGKYRLRKRQRYKKRQELRKTDRKIDRGDINYIEK